MRHLAWIGAALALAGCGTQELTSGEGSRISRYGISMQVPEGWYGEVTRGTARLGTLRQGVPLGADDVSVVLFEYEPAPPEEGPEAAAYYDDGWPARFATTDFVKPESGTLVNERHGAARQAVAVNGRLFNVFAESGERPLPQRRLEQLNKALAAIEVANGDFYQGWAQPVEFPERPGWHMVSSGASPRYAQGEYVQTAASTIPYLNDPPDLPPARTLEKLPRDGILLWIGLSRDARFPPPTWDRGETFEPRKPPYRMADLERVYGWEGQVRDISEYRLWAASGDQYLVDLRVYFGPKYPTEAMLAEADGLLRGLRFPDWGRWELDEPSGA